MRRPGFTLVEALMAILILGVGLLALLALYPLAVLNINQAFRQNRSAQAAANARAILEIRLRSYYASISTPAWLSLDPSGQSVPTRLPGVNSLTLPPGSRLEPRLDVEGPYDPITGLRRRPPDPASYTWGYLLRSAEGKLNPLDSLFLDVSVVVFQDYDPSVQFPRQPVPNVQLTRGLQTISGRIDNAQWILDSENGYMYRLSSPTSLESPARATSRTIYPIPGVVEVIELGIIERTRRPLRQPVPL